MEHPFTLVIFGGTGDLTRKKLIPALFSLYTNKALPTHFTVVCIGRRAYSNEQFFEMLDGARYVKDQMKGDFFSHIEYYRMDMSNEEEYKALCHHLDRLGQKNASKRTLFYFATAPKFFPIISKALRAQDACQPAGKDRVVLAEKPFGYDLQTARQYYDAMEETFTKSNIFLIDHYLGKEMIQNIFYLRFANHIFERIWDRESIQSVTICVKEDIGIEGRGGYYDRAGAIKDMVQSHLLQILAYVAMEPPAKKQCDDIALKKTHVLQKVNVCNKEAVFGQYEGYLQEDQVDSESTTETYAKMRVFVDNARWDGVPFDLITGKKLPVKQAQVVIRFKESESCHMADEALFNVLTIKIQPEEGFWLTVYSKKPGLTDKYTEHTMRVCRSCDASFRSVEAYERLLLEAVKGDRTLFVSFEELSAAWRIADRMMEIKEHSSLVIYDENEETLHGE